MPRETINLIKHIILKQTKKNYLKLSHVISLYKGKGHVSAKNLISCNPVDCGFEHYETFTKSFLYWINQ